MPYFCNGCHAPVEPNQPACKCGSTQAYIAGQPGARRNHRFLHYDKQCHQKAVEKWFEEVESQSAKLFTASSLKALCSRLFNQSGSAGMSVSSSMSKDMDLEHINPSFGRMSKPELKQAYNYYLKSEVPPSLASEMKRRGIRQNPDRRKKLQDMTVERIIVIHDEVSKIGGEPCPTGESSVYYHQPIVDLVKWLHLPITATKYPDAIAAKILTTIIQRQPFQDCNHRTAYTTAMEVLSSYGLTIDASVDEKEVMLRQIYKETITEDEVAEWIKSHFRSLKSTEPRRSSVGRSRSITSASRLRNSLSDIDKDMDLEHINPSFGRMSKPELKQAYNYYLKSEVPPGLAFEMERRGIRQNPTLHKESFKICSVCGHITPYVPGRAICDECKRGRVRPPPRVAVAVDGGWLPVNPAGSLTEEQQELERYRQYKREGRPITFKQEEESASEMARMRTPDEFESRLSENVRDLPRTRLVELQRHLVARQKQGEEGLDGRIDILIDELDRMREHGNPAPPLKEVIENLDDYERMVYTDLQKRWKDKPINVLHVIVNGVEGDESQLSPLLAKFAKERGWLEGYNPALKYDAFYGGKKIEVEADSSYDAQLKATEIFKPPKSKRHLVSVMIQGSTDFMYNPAANKVWARSEGESEYMQDSANDYWFSLTPAERLKDFDVSQEEAKSPDIPVRLADDVMERALGLNPQITYGKHIRCNPQTTLCECGHYPSQHHVTEEGGKRICDYAGYSCKCSGYRRKKESNSNPITYGQVADNISYLLHNIMINRVSDHPPHRDAEADLKTFYWNVFTEADRKKYDKTHRRIAKMLATYPQYWTKQQMINAWTKEMWVTTDKWKGKSVPPFLAGMPDTNPLTKDETRTVKGIAKIFHDSSKHIQFGKGFTREEKEREKKRYRDQAEVLDWVTKEFGSKPSLLPHYVRKMLPPLYSTEKIPAAEKVLYVKFFCPYSNWKWYGAEFDGADTFFGYVDGAFPEWGYFSLAELQNTKMKVMGVPVPAVERDTVFEPIKFKELK